MRPQIRKRSSMSSGGAALKASTASARSNSGWASRNRREPLDKKAPVRRTPGCGLPFTLVQVGAEAELRPVDRPLVAQFEDEWRRWRQPDAAGASLVEARDRRVAHDQRVTLAFGLAVLDPSQQPAGAGEQVARRRGRPVLGRDDPLPAEQRLLHEAEDPAPLLRLDDEPLL